MWHSCKIRPKVILKLWKTSPFMSASTSRVSGATSCKKVFTGGSVKIRQKPT
jgi:hypothetical protein